MRSVSSRTFQITLVTLLVFALLAGAALAQRPKSPKGSSSTQIGESWIDISYSAPILRGRQGIFGSGDEYGTKLYAGAPVWRVGADVTTRIKTEVDLEIGGKKVPAGEYSFFIELKEGGWTGIISTQAYLEQPDRAKIQEGNTWGAYGYSADNDVARAPMAVQLSENSIDQMIIAFTGVSDAGGNIAVAWDNQIGVLPFTVAK